MIDNTHISNKLKEYFKDKDMSQKDIAEALGISQQAVSALLNGKPFGKNTANKWCKTFGFKPNWLLTGEGEMFINAGINIQGNNNTYSNKGWAVGGSINFPSPPENGTQKIITKDGINYTCEAGPSNNKQPGDRIAELEKELNFYIEENNKLKNKIVLKDEALKLKEEIISFKNEQIEVLKSKKE